MKTLIFQLGAIAGFFIGALSISQWRSEIMKFQGLISGLLALFGALFTVLAIYNQIRKTDQNFQQERKRRDIALRANMLPALSNICRYCDECLSNLNSILNNRPDGMELHFHVKLGDTMNATLPILDASDIKILSLGIEYADERAAENVVKLVQSIQVHRTRIESDFQVLNNQQIIDRGQTILFDHIFRRMVETLEVYGRASNLFDYARNKIQVPEEMHYPSSLIAMARLLRGPQFRDALPILKDLINREYTARPMFGD